MRHVKRLIPFLFSASSLLFADGSWATENGATHFPVGVNTLSDGFLPDPGTLQFYDYMQWSNSGHEADASSDRSSPSVTAQAVVNAFRFLYTWQPTVGPFHYTTGVVLPLVHVNLDVAGKRGSAFDLGDLAIQNYFGSSNAAHTFFYFFGLDTYLPSGRYRQSALVSTGNNYYTFAPNIDLSYVPNPKWDISATLFLEYNTTNHATNYHSGNDVDIDYGLTYRPLSRLPRFGVGVQGFLYKQYEADTQNGQRVAGDGYRGQAFAIGPQLRYDFDRGGVALKYQRELDVKNRPVSNVLWLQLSVPVGS